MRTVNQSQRRLAAIAQNEWYVAKTLTTAVLSLLMAPYPGLLWSSRREEEQESWQRNSFCLHVCLIFISTVSLLVEFFSVLSAKPGT